MEAIKFFFFFSSRRRHTRCGRDWSSDVCSSDLIWDFGSAARHHQIYNPWLDGEKRARAGISTLRGAFHPDAGIAEEVEIGRASCREGVLQYVVEWRGVVKKLGKLDEVLRRETCD